MTSALNNRRILITRAQGQASELATRLQALGATTISIPAIEIAPPLSFGALDHALAHLPQYDWLLLTSANAATALQARANHHALPPLSHPQIAVIGPATARAASAIGLRPTLIPPQAVAESLAAALLPRISPGARILLVRAAAARDHLPEALTAAGAQLTIAEAYRTIIPEASVAALQQLFADPTQHPDAITFTSSSTATNLLSLFHLAGVSQPPGIVRASIGPITSQTLRDLNLPPHLESPEPTISSLVQALERHFT